MVGNRPSFLWEKDKFMDLHQIQSQARAAEEMFERVWRLL